MGMACCHLYILKEKEYIYTPRSLIWAMTGHGQIHKTLVDFKKTGKWLETHKQEDRRAYFHCSPFWILYHETYFHSKRKQELKLKGNPLSSLYLHPPRNSMKLTHSPFSCTLSVSSQLSQLLERGQRSSASGHCWRRREVWPQRLDTVGALTSLMGAKRSSTEAGTANRVLWKWKKGRTPGSASEAGGWVKGESQDPPVIWGLSWNRHLKPKVGEQWLPWKAFL